ncbi:MAG: CPBP family intramembrane glutamic endopeptidase [Candidatus Ranarchaeia archaeon]
MSTRHKPQLKNEQRIVIALIITILSWLVLPQGLLVFIGLGFDAVVLLTLQYVFVLAPLVAYAAIRKDLLGFLGFKDKISLKIILYGLLLPLALLASAFAVVSVYFALFGIPQIPDTGVSLDPGNSIFEFARVALFIMLVNAPAEEIFFRRFLQKELMETAGLGVGLVVSSAIFGVLHYVTAPVTAINAFVLGIVLGYAYYKTDSLYTTWIGHGLYNLLLVYIAFLLGPFLLV